MGWWAGKIYKQTSVYQHHEKLLQTVLCCVQYSRFQNWKHRSYNYCIGWFNTTEFSSRDTLLYFGVQRGSIDVSVGEIFGSHRLVRVRHVVTGSYRVSRKCQLARILRRSGNDWCDWSVPESSILPRYQASHSNSCAAISTSRTSSDVLFMWLAVTTAAADWKSNRLPYNLYCVGGDVKRCSINHDWKSKTHVTISKVYSSETMPRILVRLIQFMKTSDKCNFRSADLQQSKQQAPCDV